MLFAVLASLTACGSRPVAMEPVSLATPASCSTGLTFSAGVTEAAMGLRVMSVEVLNCGTQPVELNGYPQVKLLDEQRQPLTVEIIDGSGGIAQVEGFDDAPQQISLAPGERAKSAFLWRSTHASFDPPQVGSHVDIAPAQGGTWQSLPALSPAAGHNIDLGSTGRMGVKAWHR